MIFEVLTEDDINQVDKATMDILANTGVAIYEKQSMQVLEQAGADIDGARSRARIPERTIREALEKAPSRFKLAGRDGRKTVELGSGETYFANSSTGIKVLDHSTGSSRESVLADIPMFARVADALENIHFNGPAVVAHDVKGKLRNLSEMLAAVENTTKHVGHECQGTELTKHYIQMAQIIAGGETEFRKNPSVSVGGCPVSPLQFDGPETEAMLECARADMPYDVSSMAMGGGTAPMTLAGELAIINAEVLTGLTLCQLVNPGSPVIYGNHASIMDTRTEVLALGAPERAILATAVVQMARHYGIPSEVGGISTDGKTLGDQAMFEKTMTGLPPVLAGADIIFGPAVLSSYETFSLEQLVIDDEIASALTRMRKGMNVNQESLAVELIDRVGPGGSFAGTGDTLKHLGIDVWLPVLADRNTEDNWKKEGSESMCSKARKMALDILSNHEVKPLDQEQKRDIDKVMKAAAKIH